LANTTIKLLVGILTVFAGFYGVGNMLNRIDEMKIRQVTLEIKLEVIQIQLQDMKTQQQGYWNDLKQLKWKPKP
jgi:hypothetical protein